MSNSLKCLLIIFHLGTLCFGQSESGQSLQPVEIRPLPTAASLGKFGEYPVSLSSGVPSISIPLYSIESKRLSIPISLDYHASGIRVQEYASWVGLGFSLSAGGVITRTMKSRPDDEGINGYLDQISTMPSAGEINLLNSNHLNYAKNLVDLNFLDSEPDIFQLVAPGLSCSFYFKNQNEIVTSPSLPVLIKFYRPIGGNHYFTVTDENGNVYEFRTRERSMSNKGFIGNFISSWFLTRITSYDGSDVIDFVYKTHGLSLPATTSYSFNYYYGVPPGVSGDVIGHAQHEIERSQESRVVSSDSVRKLKEIRWSHGRVEFNSTTGRPDITGEYKLDEIKYYTKNCDACQETYLNKFSFSYFTNYGSRLMLDKVEQTSADKSIPPYEFEYNLPGSTASLNPNAQDHWGYHNNKNNSSLTPQLEFSNLDGPSVTLGDANRETDEAAMKDFSLKKIKYPTKGYTVFNMEANTVNYVRNLFRQETKSVSTDVDSDVFTNSTTFTLTETPAYSTLIARFGDYNNIQQFLICCGTELRCAAVLTIRNITKNTTVTINSSNTPGGIIEQALSGGYEAGDQIELSVSVDTRCFYAQGVNFELDATLTLTTKYPNGQETVSKKVGGLRVKEIVNYGSDNSIANRKNYIYEQPQFLDVPRYDTYLDFHSRCIFSNPSGGHSDCAIVDYKCLAIQGQSLSSSSSGIVGYSKVTELMGNAANNIGKKISLFTIVNDAEVSTDQFLINLPMGSQNGQLVDEKTYSQNGDLVQWNIHQYTNVSKSFVKGLAASRRVIYPKLSGDDFLAYENAFIFRDYQYMNVWSYLKKTTRTQYTPTGPVVSTDEYVYGNPLHQKLTRQITTGSKNDLLVSELMYPLDISTPDPIVSKMITDNLVATTLETKQSTEKGNVAFVNSHQVMTYQTLNNRVVLYKVEKSFNGGPLKTDLQINQYDNNFNPLEIQSNLHPTITYLWGYGGVLPVAKVSNALSSQCYYNGFEDATANFSSTAKTGLKGSTTTLAINLPSSGTYQLSYWKKSTASTWELVEALISTNTTIGGNGVIIDEVRLHPHQAQMTTYSYLPGAGITSETDMNNRTSYFEFDAMKRLSVIRDEKRAATKVIDYHYKTN